ncbi:uncharacterized protein LOC130761433 isoform X2 [Actinidia eriantha]|uniref:uncharacterized protein LOC130761433 isoform X2 n=1 Tax=Actinidia eriantha TaxID=165200 RepID=UPI002584CAAA|nr:uncharacterized protein LOC130761433 isoform X2 [Actinidia eriantha]
MVDAAMQIGSKQWRCYDFGPKIVPSLICLPGTADVLYEQIMALSSKGYRVISVDIPRVWNHHEWIQAFEKFLDAIDVHHVSSALCCLRQRNTYQGSFSLTFPRNASNLSDAGGPLSLLDQFANHLQESGSHVHKILESSRTKARTMVDASMQKCTE